MSKINILPKSVYNRIAAGEVVERPASVVKELVENSIDAGATEISVYIEGSGKQLIRVVDNGSGIERDDLPSAFLPHATSKIANEKDLERILTLGFRGEAVASIASVSKMTISSKVAGAKRYSLFSDGGSIGSITQEAGEDVGTDVRVEMLFFNTPVRFTFLKSDKAEESEITTVMSRFILSKPHISFAYYVDNKEVLRSFGGGEEEALVGVYGASVLENCYKINAEKHGIRIRGYIGNQNFFKANKSYQHVFLNGRYVLNATLSSALANAYSGYLMKRQYPFYVLHIDVPSEVVDVNVHPNKIDVRFANNNVVYGCVYSVVSAVLDGQSKALDYVVPTEKTERTEKASVSLSESILRQSKEEPAAGLMSQFAGFSGVFDEQPLKSAKSLGFEPISYEEAQKEIEKSAPAFKQSEEELAKQQEEFLKGFTPIEQIGEFTGKLKQVDIFDMRKSHGTGKKNPEKLHKKFPNADYEKIILEFDDPSYEEVKKTGEEDAFEANKKYLEALDAKAKQNKIDVTTCSYAGKLFNTYLIYEQGDVAYLIDQHAAHERLIFDRLKEKMKNRSVSVQPMLVPYTLQLNAFESVFVNEQLSNIREIGFEIQPLGGTDFQITAVPTDLQSMDVATFFNDVLGDISGYRAIKLEDILKDKLASAACKAAVKGGMDLTQEEVDALFKLMDGDMGLKCPHGRPVVVKMTKTQFEKMFKRIV